MNASGAAKALPETTDEKAEKDARKKKKKRKAEREAKYAAASGDETYGTSMINHVLDPSPKGFNFEVNTGKKKGRQKGISEKEAKGATVPPCNVVRKGKKLRCPALRVPDLSQQTVKPSLWKRPARKWTTWKTTHARRPRRNRRTKRRTKNG
jgi:hypothetical protein